MEKVQLGKSGLMISPMVFGAWAIGGWKWGGTDDNESLRALQAGVERGITSIDTAPVYGLGHSEELIGRLVKKVGRDRLQILTKYGLNWSTTKGEYLFDSAKPGGTETRVYSYAGKDGIIQEVEDSLSRLKTDYIDLYQIHRPDSTTPIDETMEAMIRLKEQGKIRAAGVSNFTVDESKDAEQIMSVASCQSPYSMVYRKIEKELIPHCLNNGNGILAYSPLQRGLLTGKITTDYEFSGDDHRPSNRFFKEPNLSRTNFFLDKIRPIAESHDATLSQLVINWTLNRPAISAVLVGARNEQQITENAASLDFALSGKEVKTINDELSQLIIE